MLLDQLNRMQQQQLQQPPQPTFNPSVGSPSPAAGNVGTTQQLQQALDRLTAAAGSTNISVNGVAALPPPPPRQQQQQQQSQGVGRQQQPPPPPVANVDPPQQVSSASVHHTTTDSGNDTSSSLASGHTRNSNSGGEGGGDVVSAAVDAAKLTRAYLDAIKSGGEGALLAPCRARGMSKNHNAKVRNSDVLGRSIMVQMLFI